MAAARKLVPPPSFPVRTEEELQIFNPTSIRLHRALLDAAQRLAEARGYSRNHVLAVLVEWGLAAMFSTGNAPELEGLLVAPPPTLTPRARRRPRTQGTGEKRRGGKGRRGAGRGGKASNA